MKAIEITSKEYSSLHPKYFSSFDLPAFILLNEAKVDKIKYFVFNDGKNRFCIAGGLKNNILKFPFSASFACLNEITLNNKINYYHQAIQALIEWSKTNQINSIRFAAPPESYNISHITKIQNALICCGFEIESIDVNFELMINQDIDYTKSLNSDARRHLKNSVKHGLVFLKTDNIDLMYDVIRQNRESKGYPLWMSSSDIENTSKIIKSDYFLVQKEGEIIASAFVHHITKDIVRIVYWGNLPNSDIYRPMYFMAYNIYEYYKTLGKRFIDIGTSTVDGVPNYGLCDFKESIGCICSPKINWLFNNI